MDLGALAPDEADPYEPVIDLDALGPSDGDAMSEPTIDLEALAPDLPDDAQEDDKVDSEPVHTRTLAELYVRQGFTDRALDVYRHLLEREPDSQDLRDRIAQIESGEASAIQPEEASGTAAPSAMEGLLTDRVGAPEGTRTAAPTTSSPASGDVEEIARDLVDQGEADAEIESPFAWGEDHPGDEADDDDTDAAGYFDSLLDWNARDER
jgi:hypothetical protein